MSVSWFFCLKTEKLSHPMSVCPKHFGILSNSGVNSSSEDSNNGVNSSFEHNVVLGKQ